LVQNWKFCFAWDSIRWGQHLSMVLLW
jgi:hypothetical protein